MIIKENHGASEEILARRCSLRSHFGRQIFAVRLHRKFYKQTNIHAKYWQSKRNVSPKILRGSREKKTASLRRLRFGRSLFAACFYYTSRHQAQAKSDGFLPPCRSPYALEPSSTRTDRSLPRRTDIGGDWKLATRVYPASIPRVSSCNRNILMVLRENGVSARNSNSG